MRQINLLPPELAAKRKSRQVTGGVLAAGGVLLALLVILFITQQARLSMENSNLRKQETANADIQRQVNALSQLTQQQQRLKSKQEILTALTKTEVRWSLLLTEVSLVIPPDDWLTNFTGASTTASATGPAGNGTIQFSGCTLTPPDGTHLNVAQFLIQIAKPAAFADDPFLNLSAKGAPETCPVQFNASVSLTSDAFRSNQKGGARQP